MRMTRPNMKRRIGFAHSQILSAWVHSIWIPLETPVHSAGQYWKGQRRRCRTWLVVALQVLQWWRITICTIATGCSAIRGACSIHLVASDYFFLFLYLLFLLLLNMGRQPTNKFFPRHREDKCFDLASTRSPPQSICTLNINRSHSRGLDACTQCLTWRDLGITETCHQLPCLPQA